MLHADERIVDIVVGDAILFEVTGADNVSFIKPLGVGAPHVGDDHDDFDRTHSFDVSATDAHRPDEVVRVLWEPAAEAVDSRSLAGSMPGSRATSASRIVLHLDEPAQARVAPGPFPAPVPGTGTA